MRQRFAYAMGLAVLLALVGYVATRENLLSALTDVSIGQLAAMLGASLIAAELQGRQFSTATQMFGLHLERREWFGLTVVNTMVNYLFPARAGLVVRAAYLQRFHALGLARYAALTAMLMLISITVASTVGLLAYLARMATGESGSMIGLVFAATALLSLGLPWMGHRIAGLGRRSPRLQSAAVAFQDGLAVWRSRKALLARFAMVSLAWILAQAARLWLAFNAVGLEPSAAEILIVQALVGVAFFISITPGNLGVKEGVVAFAAAALGIDGALALAAALLDRAVAFSITMLLGVLLGRPLLHKAVAHDPDPAK